MKNKYLFLFSSLCTYLCFLGLVLALKNPLCIDSTVVHKIDRVTAVTTDTAYACHLKKSVEYSDSLDQLIETISPTVDRTVLLLQSIQPFKNQIELVIREDRPLMFQVEKNKIQIGSQFTHLDQHFSRALIKAWVQENQTDQVVLEETVTDLLLYILNGKIEIEDPVDRTRTKLGSVKWPQVLKQAKGYCLSAWKYAEHMELCSQAQIGDDEAIIYSLRPLLTSAMINSFREMSARQQSELIRLLPMLLPTLVSSAERNTEPTNPLHRGMNHINKFTELLKSTPLTSAIHGHLQNYGVTDSFMEAYFDYIFEYEGAIDPMGELYKSVEDAALKNPQIQVAVKDDKRIWILPSKTALPITVFNQVQARQTLLIGCPAEKNKSMDQYFKKTEKLMLMSNCHQKALPYFEPLFREGIKSFIRTNPKISFVQLHMPSLEMVYNKFPQSQDFFELVKNRDLNRKELKTLGWSQVHWKKDLQAYRPECVIDAIEYFRN